jgi:hypothetical protein
MNTYVHLLKYLAQFLPKTRQVSNKSCRGNQNTHFMFMNLFFYRIVHEITWKNMVQPDRPHALCMLHNQGYRYTFRICRTHCFSTATMVTRTRLYATFISTLPVLFRWNPVSKRLMYRITQVILLCCNIQSDSEGKIYIFGGNVTGHCEKRKFIWTCS